jgi:hypothetical protein
MGEYWKAIVAAIVTGVGAVTYAVNAARTDGEVTGEEWGTIAGAVVVAVVTTYGVYKKRNAPSAS